MGLALDPLSRHAPLARAWDGTIDQFLEHLAQSEKESLAALEQAREAITFLYDSLLKVPIGDLPYPAPPKLFDRFRRAIRLRHYTPRTESRYVEWADRYGGHRA